MAKQIVGVEKSFELIFDTLKDHVESDQRDYSYQRMTYRSSVRWVSGLLSLLLPFTVPEKFDAHIATLEECAVLILTSMAPEMSPKTTSEPDESLVAAGHAVDILNWLASRPAPSWLANEKTRKAVLEAAEKLNERLKVADPKDCGIESSALLKASQSVEKLADSVVASGGMHDLAQPLLEGCLATKKALLGEGHAETIKLKQVIDDLASKSKKE